MANYVTVTDGPFSTITTWGTVTNTPAFGTGIVPITSTNYSTTFTAPNIKNACVGVLVYVATTTPAGGYTYTMTLQEATVDTAATVTINDTEFPPVQNWIFFKFPTPYVFTAITADRYRFKLVCGGSGTTDLRLYSNTGTSTTIFLIQAVDDRAAVPGAGENIYIIGANGSTQCTVIMDGTKSVGAGTDTAFPVQKTLGNAVTISKAGLLNWDIVASATITVKGHIVVHSGGELRIGTVAVPYPADKLANIIFDPVATCNHALMPFGNGTILMQGAPKSSTALWKTTYVSGVGTTADPMILATSVNWSVNDEIIVGASSDNATNYQESENKFIKKVVSPTTFVISDSKGGAESALTYTHNSNARVLNVERNILINTTNIAKGWYFCIGASNTYDTRNFDWCRFETLGTNTINKYGFQISSQLGTRNQVDYCVAYRPLYYGFSIMTSKEGMSFTGLIACNSAVGSSYGMYLYPTNSSFTDCISIKSNTIGIAAIGVGNTFTRCIAISSGLGSAKEGFYMGSSIGNIFDDCETHCNQGAGLNAINTLTNLLFNNFLCGTKGLNQSDIVLPADYFFTMKFINSYFYYASYLPGYLDLLSGSEICFATLNGVTNTHIWYTNLGTAQSTGAGLGDSIVRTPGSLAVRLSPENATLGFTWEFNIICPSNSIINFFGYFKKNAAFGTDIARVELWLPNSTTADDTFTLADNTTWQPCSLSKTYTGSVNKVATIKVIGLTVAAGAYLYCDDFYNAGDTVASYDKVTGLDTWYQGKPISIISPQQVSAADIWTFSTNDLTTAATTGKRLMDASAEATVETHVTNSLNTYDPPTRAEATTDKESIITEVNANETKIDTIDGIVDSILTDTGTTLDTKINTIGTDLDDTEALALEVESDLANGGRLDAIFDAIKTKTDTIYWTDVTLIKDIEGGRWHRSGTKLYLYKSDNATLVATFSLKKTDGSDATEADSVFEQTRD